MKRLLLLSAGVGLTGFCLASLPGRADNGELSPEHLDLLDQRGYFTPGFKEAVHDLVNARQSLEQAKTDEKKFGQDLPGLQKQAADAQAAMSSLRQELAKYKHPEEADFVALQDRMKDAGATPEEQIVLAQAYVWAYAASPHLDEARQDLEQAQKKLADRRQAAKEAEAARVAARTKLIQRAQAHDLSLNEWRDFLLNMSQEDLLKYLGRPNSQNDGYWTYSGDWTTDAVTHRKVGIQINFNASRVLSVAELPPAQ